MKTRKDAERVIELCDKRKELQKASGTIRMADAPVACDKARAIGMRVGGHDPIAMPFVHLVDEFRTLVKHETDQQIAAIDKELKALGVAPDEFDAAAPAAAERNDIGSISRRAIANLPKYGTQG